MPGVLFIALILTIASCSEGTMGPDGVLTGAWGGVGAALVATVAGGSVEFDCAHGSFGTLMAQDGEFEITGTWSREGGPARELEVFPATYAGLADDGRLTFTVHVAGEKHPFGPYVVERSEAPLLRKCL